MADVSGVETVTIDLAAPPPVQPAPVAAAPAAPSAFTGKPGNFAADLAALAAEQAVANPTAPVAAEPAVPQAEVQVPPAITESATAPVTVPDKFKAPDGSLDTAKLEKSTQDAEAALAKYLSTEKELRRKMNEVNSLKQAPQSLAPTPVAPPANSFAAQLEADMAQHGAGAVLVRLFEAAKEAAKSEVAGDVYADREDRLAEKSRRELEMIAKHDPAVLGPEGLEALARIRQARPWMEKAENPTSEAYKVYLAEKIIQQRQTGMVQPTPTGLTARPSAVPVGPTPRAVVQTAGPNIAAMTADQISKYAESLGPEGEKAFWKARGLSFR